MKKNQIRVIIFLLFIAVSIFAFFNFIKVNKSPQIESKLQPQIGAKPLSEAEYASLSVLGKTYKTQIKDKDTVYDAMESLQTVPENNFSFKYKEYPGMGIFVTEINGVGGSPGKYWIYYVNGVEASVSVSKNIIKSGDIISWKQE